MKYTLKIVTGKGRGKQIGVPTINMEIPIDFPVKQGIYAGLLYFNEKKYPAAIHFGPRPTFSEDDISLEAYILGDFRDPTPQTVELELVSYIRDIKNFTNPTEMVSEIRQDVAKIEKALKMNE